MFLSVSHGRCMAARTVSIVRRRADVALRLADYGGEDEGAWLLLESAPVAEEAAEEAAPAAEEATAAEEAAPAE